MQASGLQSMVCEMSLLGLTTAADKSIAGKRLPTKTLLIKKEPHH
jgi:hypothetical protein